MVSSAVPNSPYPGPKTSPTHVRERAFLISIVVIVLVGALGWTQTVPYVALGPGPVTNTLSSPGGQPLIQVSGFKTYPTSGDLDLTTVEVTTKLTLFGALAAWANKDRAVVPRDLIFPPDQTASQTDQENKTEMADSRVDAVTAALAELNLLQVVVQTTAKGSPAATALKKGDQIIGINGQTIHSAFDIQTDIAEVKVGQRVAVRFLRDGSARTVVLRTVASAQDATHPVIGVTLAENTKKGDDVKIVGLDDVGGPSAGLMFTLGIYDVLTPGDLTGGKLIIGTGTIDGGGNVGAIGGIQLKMIAAKKQGATWFLTPADNCAEALRSVPHGLHLAKVATLDQAISAVKSIAAGSNAIPTC